MSLIGSGLFLLLPLGFYLLHALWRLIASDSLIARLAVIFSYICCAWLFRLYIPTLPTLPLWLPFLYGYIWLGGAGTLALLASGRFSLSGVWLEGMSLRMGCYFLAQSSLLIGTLALDPLLAGRPLQALASLPPLVAILAYWQYRMLFNISLKQQRTPWWALGFVTIITPVGLCWLAELLVPLLLRHL